MARKNKPYAERRKQLLDAAWDLFSTNGWDGTTVQAVIDRLEVSKGTFYHYFESKEDLLDAVVERQSIEAMTSVRAAVEQEEPALAKIKRFVAATREWRLRELSAFRNVTRILYQDENIIILHKMKKRNMEMVLPLLSDIVAQGIAEGVFDVTDPEETAELFLNMSAGFGDTMVRLFIDLPEHPENADRLMRRAHVYLRSLEKIFGLPRNSIGTPDRHFYEGLKEDRHE